MDWISISWENGRSVSRYMFHGRWSLVARYFRGDENLWQVIARKNSMAKYLKGDGCLVTMYFMGDGSFVDKYRFHGRWVLSGKIF